MVTITTITHVHVYNSTSMNMFNKTQTYQLLPITTYNYKRVAMVTYLYVGMW